MRVALMIQELDIKCALKPSTTENDKNTSKVIKFVEGEPSPVVVEGDAAVLLYLDAVYGSQVQADTPMSRIVLAKRFTRFEQSLALLHKWRFAMHDSAELAEVPTSVIQELDTWEGYVKDMLPISQPSLVDFAFWPVLHDIVRTCGDKVLEIHPSLSSYYQTMKSRDTVAKVLEE